MPTKKPLQKPAKTLKKKATEKYSKVEIEEVDEFPPEAIKLIPASDALKRYANVDGDVLQRWIATLDGKVVGLVTIESPSVHGLSHLAETLYLQVIVSPKARGKGIGDKLVETAILDAHDAPAHWAGFTHHSEGFKHLAKKYGIRDNDDVSRYDEDDPHWKDDGTFDHKAYHKDLYNR